MSAPKIAAIIPSRMGSSRFPGKPLIEILGLPMIEHVRRRVALAPEIDEVYVATCDREIKETVESYGGLAIMTKDSHERCTERVHEAAAAINADLIVIVAGDEPLFQPEVIAELLRPLKTEKNVDCINLVSVIKNHEEIKNPDVVKVVLDQKHNIMLFSRAEIPYFRVKTHHPVYRQTGTQMFSKKLLDQYVRWPQTPLEIIESVDLMRILEHGIKIKAAISHFPSYWVDRPTDLPGIVHAIQNDPSQAKYYNQVMAL